MRRVVNYYMRHLVIAFHAIILCGCQPDKLFTALSTEHTNVTFTNQLKESEEININQYLYAHNGGGVATGDINNDGLPDIYFTANQLPNKLYLNKGSFVFEDITNKAQVEGFSGPSS
ncbi:MAG TPA: VCBS repeat-containing protein, partial [Chryseolinea sp.]|nr:VCBS repeat-containing protein [Chryseolinea sp.]